MHVMFAVAMMSQWCFALQPATRPLGADELLAMAPQISGADPDAAAFEWTCHWSPLDATILVKKVGDEAAMLVEQDGTPVVVVAEGRALVYDALKGRMMLFQGVRPEFALQQVDDVMKVHFGLGAARPGDPAHALDLDLRSCLSKEGHTYGTEPAPDGGTLLVVTTPRNNKFLATISSDPVAYQRVELMGDGEDEPILTVRSLRTGAEVTREHLRFPKTKDYEGLPGVIVPADRPDAFEAGIKAMVESLLIRTGINDEDARTRVERQVSGQLDWDALKLADDKFTARLRETLRAGR